MTHEELLEDCRCLGIKVKELNLRSSDGRVNGNRIAINKNLSTTVEKKCVLIEELGHYLTTHGNILNQENILNIKQELFARKWAYEKLIPLESLISAFELGLKTRFEISEYLNVTEEFLDNVINHYRIKYGTYRHVGKYIIYFEPNLIIGKSFKQF